MCLGILVDTETLTVSIPPEKLHVINKCALSGLEKNGVPKKNCNHNLVHCSMLPNVLRFLVSF